MSKIFGKCLVCGEYDFYDKHICLPVFFCKDVEGNFVDDWVKIYALSFENAAKKFAEKYDAEECCMLDSSSSIEVLIFKPPKSTEIKICNVTGEVEPHYYASDAEEYNGNLK